MSSSGTVRRLTESEMIVLVERRKQGGVLLGRGGFGNVLKVNALTLSPPMDTASSPSPHSSMSSGTPQFLAVKESDGVTKMGKKNAMKDLAHEWELLRNLNHPNIVTALGFYQELDCAYLAMPCYISNLGNAVTGAPQTTETYNTGDLVSFCKDIASGLYYLVADRKILHRDISTRNIFVTHDKKAVIGDFGIAIPIGKKNSGLGYDYNSHGYVAPELIFKQALNNINTETFAFGHVLRCVLAGRPYCKVWEVKGGRIHSLVPAFFSQLAPLNRVIKKDPQPEAIDQLFYLMTKCVSLEEKDRCPPERWVKDTEAAMSKLVLTGGESLTACADVSDSEDYSPKSKRRKY
ncbi:protein kinase family protein [Sansalvadorimonas verongulae]|uniref:protein kinase family protein n=1 Tax=Sansalvadorimonas verongulae TaxID=2172824 RepID=UPI001E512CAB|nr:protein kinase family protein [Sansalvadorimonas verongulae]